MRLLVTRPEPDATQQAEKLRGMGHEPVLAPLLTIEMLPCVPLDLEGAQAVIVTSRNVLRAIAARPELIEARNLPLYAVGDATARMAAELGFRQIVAGPGTGEQLADLIARELDPGKGALVHLAGGMLAFDMKSALEAKGFTIRQPALYQAVAAEALPANALGLLLEGRLDGAIFMSPRTAAIFAGLTAAHGVVTQASQLRCYCLSQAVAGALAPLGAKVVVSPNPREEELLALIAGEAASSR
jgi:uroporphyrinogen-III synthase